MLVKEHINIYLKTNKNRNQKISSLNTSIYLMSILKFILWTLNICDILKYIVNLYRMTERVIPFE